MMKKILRSLGLFAAVDFAFVGAMNALAAEPIAYLDWDAANRRMTNAVCTTYEVVTEATSAFADGKWYVVTNGSEIVRGGITVSGTSHLILCDGGSLKVDDVADYQAGVSVQTGVTLTIYGQSEGSGKLVAWGGYDAAGIGGGYRNNCGVVTINGGTVTAMGYGGAGIGGGEYGDCGTVTINGGTVTAEDDEGYGAGIGGGYYGNGGTVTINGGTVTAMGNEGAGIGGGYKGNGADVTINGGTVTAIGEYYGAGIGGGREGNGANVTINGGTVTAAGDYGAGIGGGYYGDCGTVSINGGKVTAKSDYASGIGGGYYGIGGTVTINGGTVTATGEIGIGGEEDYEKGALAISGGRVKASGYRCLWSTLLVGADIRVELDGVVKTPGGDGYVELSGNECDLLAEKVDLIQYADVTYLDANGASQTRRCQVFEECRNYLCDGQWYAVPAGADLTNNWLYVVGSAHLVLCDGGKLTLTGEDSKFAGVCVTTGKELTIYGQTAGSGELFAQGGSFWDSGSRYHGAGIGGYGPKESGTADGGTVTINGGTVTAVGVEQGAGIGGGYQGNGGTVVINGGTVKATGGVNGHSYGGAGIGGGHEGNGGTVTINGGKVTASGDTGYGAGIGGGYNGAGGEVTITGGEVTATGGAGGAGIGGGYYRDAGVVTIAGGTVTATGGDAGAGIGGGCYGAGGTITINGGTVTATGSVEYYSAAGIGGGNDGDGGTVTINGGTVTASGSKYGAGIGAVGSGNGGAVTINGGTVTATGGVDGAGIGGGSNGDAGTITINGGTVTATGGEFCAGIGKGHWGTCSYDAVTFGEDFSGFVYAGADAASAVEVDPEDYDGETYVRILSTVTLSIPAVPGCACIVSNATEEIRSARLNGVNTYRVAKGDAVKVYFALQPGSHWVKAPTANPMSLGTLTEDLAVDLGALPTVRQDPVAYLDWDEANGLMTNAVATVYEVVTETTDAFDRGRTYVVTGDVVIEKEGVGIRVDGTVAEPSRLVLCDGSSLTVTADPAILVTDEGEVTHGLVICGQTAGTGRLTVTGLDNLGGIGGGAEGVPIYGSYGTCGAVTINGGTVTATGGYFGAGIGAGHRGGGCGTITINGGTVTATGGTYGAGIGGGYRNDGCGTVTINGGTVTAASGLGGAGIGGGFDDGLVGGYVTVTINGGTVKATGSVFKGGICAQAIGDAYMDSGATVTFDEGTIFEILAGDDAESATNVTAEAFSTDHATLYASVESFQSVKVPAAAKGISYVVSNATEEIAGVLAGGVNTYVVPKGDEVKIYFTLENDYLFAGEFVNPLELGKLGNNVVLTADALPKVISLAEVRSEAKAAVEAAAGDAAHRSKELQSMVDAAKAAIDAAKSLADIEAARSSALAAIAEYEAVPVLYENPASDPFEGNATYNGWVRGADGSVAGTLTIKAGKAAKPERGGQSKLTIQYTPFGEKRKTIKLEKTAMPVAGGNPVVDIPGVGKVVLGGGSFAGQDVDIQMGQDLTKSKDREVKAAAKARMAAKAGVWTFALATDAGYAALSVTVSTKGKGKLAGTLPDGTKVSLSVQGVLGDNALAIPFMYSKKSSLGFVFWVFEDGTVEVSDFTALRQPDGRSLAVTQEAVSVTHRLADGPHVFMTPFFEQAFEVAGRKWIFPKQQKKLGDADPNPFGAKLTFTEKTGVVKGSFAVLDPTGRKQKYTVNGVVVGDVMYGSALLKKVGSVECAAE